jgi:sulfite reductase (NADPH) hemoprotein beta-component
VGQPIGKGFSADEVVDGVETIINTYLQFRQGPDETFLAAFRRLGDEPFKEALYAGA